jgi:dTMP kinase
MLITLEGIDGVGKTSICDGLAERFPYAIMTREPQDKSFIAEHARTRASRTYAYMLDHAHHVEDLISKKNDDELIICDRYIDSRCVYQSVDSNVPISRIRNFHFDEFTPTPDLTIILIADINEIKARLKKRDGDQYYNDTLELSEEEVAKREKEYLTMLQKVQNKYLQIAKKEPERCFVIDVTYAPLYETVNYIEKVIVTKFSKKIENFRLMAKNRKVIAESITRIC